MKGYIRIIFKRSVYAYEENIFVDAFSFEHFALKTDNAFNSDFVDFFKQIGRAVDYTLRDAEMVAQVNKTQISQISLSVYPTGEFNLLSGVFNAELAAVVSAISVHKNLFSYSLYHICHI